MKTGITTGTGAILGVEVGYKPSCVELEITESSITGYNHEDMRDGTMAITSVGELNSDNIIIGASLPFIGSTDTQLGSRRCVAYYNAAAGTPIDVPAVLAGTAFTATTHDVTAGNWRSYLLSVPTGAPGTIAIQVSASNYATEALAIAALPTVTVGNAILGYITIEATSGAIFDAQVDALEGGSSGTPAESTNYYEGYGVMTGGITLYGSSETDYDAQVAAGLTTYVQGFTLGTNALVNALGSIILWKAYRD